MSKKRRAPSRGRDGKRTPRTETIGARFGRVPPILLASGAVVVLGVLAAGVLFLTGLWGNRGGPAATSADQARLRPPGTSERRAAKIDATGRLLLVLQSGLSLVTLPDRQERLLVPTASRALVTSARWRPDGRAAAYALVQWRPGEAAAQSAIYLTDLTVDPQPLIQDDRPKAILEAPAWSPDGTALYFASTVTENQQSVQRLERFDLASRTRTPLGEGFSPDVSPDGGLLAVVRYAGVDPVLVLLRSDGTLVRTLIGPGRFTLIGSPRFSPDGQQIAVALAKPPGSAWEPSPHAPFAIFDTPIAQAHGNPSEVYVLDVAGGQPQRLTSIAEDEPAVTWSPDGSTVAVYATRGLHLVDRQGRTTLALDGGGYGGLDWAP